MKYTDLKKELLGKKELRKIRVKNQLAYDVANMVLDARIKKGLTQSQLAKKIGTKQPSIARIENGDYVPTLTFLEKIAKALDTELIVPSFGFAKIIEPVADGFSFESDAILCSKELTLGTVSFKFEIKNNSSEAESLYPSKLEECHG